MNFQELVTTIYGAKVGCGYITMVRYVCQVSFKSEAVLIICVELTWNMLLYTMHGLMYDVMYTGNCQK